MMSVCLIDLREVFVTVLIFRLRSDEKGDDAGT